MKNIKKVKKGIKKISLLRFSPLWKKGPNIVPFFKIFYQKDTSDVYGANKLLFSPIDYDSENSFERKKMAFKDAKNHRSFYVELIQKGVYPQGTTVNIKKKKHSDPIF